jgi:hypothetical protein
MINLMQFTRHSNRYPDIIQISRTIIDLIFSDTAILTFVKANFKGFTESKKCFESKIYIYIKEKTMYVLITFYITLWDVAYLNVIWIKWMLKVFFEKCFCVIKQQLKFNYIFPLLIWDMKTKVQCTRLFCKEEMNTKLHVFLKNPNYKRD